jgi:hypothetical protein
MDTGTATGMTGSDMIAAGTGDGMGIIADRTGITMTGGEGNKAGSLEKIPTLHGKPTR